MLLFAAACQRDPEIRDAARLNPETLYNSGRLGFKEGRFSDAGKIAEKGYRTFLGSQSEWHWKFALLLAEIRIYDSNPAGATDLLLDKPPARFASLVARHEMLSGYTHAWANDKGVQAKALMSGAITDAKNANDPETQADAWLWFGMAQNDHGETQAANAAFQRAQELADANHLDYQHAQAMLNRGWIQTNMERYAAAIPLLESAQQLAERAHARLLRAAASNDLALCYENLGDVDRALELQEKNVAEIEQVGLETYRSIAYTELGAIRARRNELPEATRAFQHAFDVARKGSPTYALGAENLAAVLEQTGNLGEAERYNRIAFQFSNPHDKSNLGTLTLTQAMIAEHRGLHDEAIETYQKALSIGKDAPSVLWQANAGLAGVYAAKGDVQRADASFAKTIKIISLNRADQLTADYKLTFLSNLMRFYQDYVDFLMKHGSIGHALEIADSSRASVLREDLLGQSEPSHAGLTQQLQRAAKVSHGVFLFYWLAPKNCYLWAISGTQSKAVPLAEQNQIAQDVTSYRALVEEQKKDPLTMASPAGARLYQELIAPVASLVTAGAHVVVVPDGVLHNLNFETLLVSTPAPHYWIEDVTISVAPSLGILQAAKARAQTSPRSLLAMGNADLTGTGFPPLPEAEAEIANVQRQFPDADSKVFTGRNAVADAYFAAQPQKFSTIHFATHVDANARSPLDSAIILSPQANGFKLYARDVARTPINADLVTISACRSAGATTLVGEGLVGFAWAFFQAHAQNVVTSLWDVYDNSTAQLMADFYKGVVANQPYASALRGAKLKMLHSNYTKPYYWAPFQLYSRTLNSVK